MTLFIVDDWEDMTDAIAEGDVDVIDTIYKVIKKAVKRKYKRVKIFSIMLSDDPNSEHDWYLKRQEFVKALENCLNVYINLERYEDCADIKKMIEYLSEKEK